MPPVLLQEIGCNKSHLTQEINKNRQLEYQSGCKHNRSNGLHVGAESGSWNYTFTYLIVPQKIDRKGGDYIITKQNTQNAWRLYPEVYDFPQPDVLIEEPRYHGTFLNILAFTGQAPRKVAVGGKITTFENFIIISDPAGQKNKIWLNLPGLEEGWHFKFSFPEMKNRTSVVNRIKVFVDGEEAAELALLEDLGRVADYTFQVKKNIIYFKTITRTVVKGIAAHKAKEKLKKETKTEDNFILRNIINLGVDAIFDATENPDLRIWSSLPQFCYAGEIVLPPGVYDIRIQFIGQADLPLSEKSYPEVIVGHKLNLLETFYLDWFGLKIIWRGSKKSYESKIHVG